MSESLNYILGTQRFPMSYGPKEWKLKWFPDWFLSIEDCFKKVSLPQPDIRLEYLLYSRFRANNRSFLEGAIEEKQFEALKKRGIFAVMSGECPVIRTNMKDFFCSTFNYSKNEFNNYEILQKLAKHLDIKLLEWHDKEEWFKDLWDNLEKEYWNKIK